MRTQHIHGKRSRKTTRRQSLQTKETSEEKDKDPTCLFAQRCRDTAQGHKKTAGEKQTDSMQYEDAIRSESPYKMARVQSNKPNYFVLREQELLKKRLVLKDDFLWKISPSLPNSEESVGKNRLHYIGGVDLSFSKDDSSIACGALIVVDLNTLCVVYEDFDVVHLTMPYIPGFLAFRECHVLLGLLEKMKLNGHPFYPQLLMVDGNGILHPRGFGLASHLAILSDLPTIGVGKNLHHIDGLTHMEVKHLLPKNTKRGGDVTTLVGKSGHTWGAALRCNESCSKPIFISIGHRISLETAISIVRMCCRFRVPEPIRQADIRSREYLQKKLTSTGKS